MIKGSLPLEDDSESGNKESRKSGLSINHIFWGDRYQETGRKARDEGCNVPNSPLG